MPGIKKLLGGQKKQKNVTHNNKKIQSTESELELTQILEQTSTVNQLL